MLVLVLLKITNRFLSVELYILCLCSLLLYLISHILTATVWSILCPLAANLASWVGACAGILEAFQALSLDFQKEDYIDV